MGIYINKQYIASKIVDKLINDKEKHLNLFLLADEQLEMVKKYLLQMEEKQKLMLFSL